MGLRAIACAMTASRPNVRHFSLYGARRYTCKTLGNQARMWAISSGQTACGMG
jgi:hypothetical protein